MVCLCCFAFACGVLCYLCLSSLWCVVVLELLVGSVVFVVLCLWSVVLLELLEECGVFLYPYCLCCFHTCVFLYLLLPALIIACSVLLRLCSVLHRLGCYCVCVAFWLWSVAVFVLPLVCFCKGGRKKRRWGERGVRKVGSR